MQNVRLTWQSNPTQHLTATTHDSVAPCRRYIATDLAQQVLAKEDFKSAVLDRTPAGRVGEPDEVAGATLSGVVIRRSCGKMVAILSNKLVAKLSNKS